MTTDEIITAILKREGGYTNHAADRGGPTNFGITQARLADWRGHPVSADDVKALTENEAKNIYKVEYIERPGFSQIFDPMLQALLVDAGVNHGPRRAIKWLQKAVGEREDGVIGPKTLAAVTRLNSRKLYMEVLAQRIEFYGRLVTNDHSQAVFAAGWNARAAEFVRAAA